LKIAEQTWDPESYARNARFVSDLGVGVVDLLDPKPGEHVLDLGCGDGALTEMLVERGCNVIGMDSSGAQVTAARARGLDARVGDARVLQYEEAFDAVFTNATLHWIDDIDSVLAGVRRALRPGGRFVGEFGGKGNVKHVISALYSALARRGVDGAALNPWRFLSESEFRHALEDQGFDVDQIVLFPRPTTLPGSVEDWIELFCKTFLAKLNESDRRSFMREVADALRPEIYTTDSGWVLDYMRLRFVATKPAGR